MGSSAANPLRVLMMLDAFDIGGTETHILSVTRQLMKQGVSVFAAGDSGPLENKFRELACPMYIAGGSGRRLEEWVRNNRIDVIHAHMESSGKLGMELSRKLNLPFIYTIHGMYYHDSVLNELSKPFPVKPLVICVSPPVQRWLGKRGIRSVLIPNGIDMQEYSPKTTDLRKAFRIPNQSKVILYASRLEDQKYEICKLLIDVFERSLLTQFPDVQLLVAGGGLNTDDIERRIRNSNCPGRIRYIGNRTDMADLYAMSDYVIGTGRVALEAIACERPVIAIGSRGVFGLVMPDNLEPALKSHFCDHRGHLPLDSDTVKKAIAVALLLKSQHHDERKEMRDQIMARMRISLVTQDIRKQYTERVQERNR